MNKKTLRDLYLSKRKTLTTHELQSRNALIFEKVSALVIPGTAKKNLHIFSSIPAQFEIDTWPIIEWFQQQGHQVVLPRVVGKRKLTHHLFENREKLKVSRWGIPEPDSPYKVDPQIIDMVFIPMICFDRTGNRIGYGGGYYDTFLNQTRSDCLKIGLCLTPPLDHIPYAEAHDIKLDRCITHLKEYRF